SAGPDPDQPAQRLLPARVARARRGRAEEPGDLPPRARPGREAGGAGRAGGGVHARRAGRGRVHESSAGSRAPRHGRVPAEGRERPGGCGGRILPDSRLGAGGRDMRRGAVFAASLGLVVSACAYFNSLYNAKRHFAEAERAAAQGNPGAAYASYGLALEKAAKSLRQSPQGRWADDALFLIARSHFGRSDYPAARAALQRLVAETGDKRIRMGAQAYLGATEYRLANYHAAILHLDAAVEGGGGSGDMLAFAHLWR